MGAHRYDFSNEKDVAKIRKRVFQSYTKILKKEDGWEDCAQELILKFLKGQGQHQTIDQAVIDYLRERSGRKGLPGYSERQSFNNPHSYEQGSFDSFIGGGPVLSVEDRLSVKRLIGMSRHWERAVMNLIYMEGYGQVEVGDFFGVSGSRVCQWVARIQSRISTRIKTENARAARKRSAKMERLLPPETGGYEWGMEQNTLEGMARCQSWGVASINEASF